jgi:hypothetical protein
MIWLHRAATKHLEFLNMDLAVTVFALPSAAFSSDGNQGMRWL